MGLCAPFPGEWSVFDFPRQSESEDCGNDLGTATIGFIVAVHRVGNPVAAKRRAQGRC